MDIRWINRQRPLGVRGPRCDGCGERISFARDLDGFTIRFCPSGCRAGTTGLPIESSNSRELQPRNTPPVIELAPEVAALAGGSGIVLAE